jgi:hypothetical protein
MFNTINKKNSKYPFYDTGASTILLTNATINKYSHKPQSILVVALYVSIGAFIKVYRFHDNCKTIIAIPCIPNKLDSWKECCVSEIIDESGNKTEKQPTCIKNKLVEKAIDDFSSKPSIIHPRDKDIAALTFRTLKHYNVDYDTDEIMFYLLQEKHWEPRFVKAVTTVGKKIREGKKVQGGEKSAKAMETAFSRWNKNLSST